MFRTRFGLRVRAVGENPHAADSLGVSVGLYRTMCVLLGGSIASLGGVWLASYAGLFVSGMSAGKGYIALAAMIVGKWKPWGAAAACLIFGGAEALQTHLQISQQGIPKQLFQAMPYVITLIVIAGLIGRSTPPAAVGVPYEKERD
jgi:simple sugar transport system permease protein